MSNAAFGALVLFEVLVAFFAALTLYVLWWPNVQLTALAVPEITINCADPGRVPHYTMQEAVRKRILFDVFLKIPKGQILEEITNFHKFLNFC